MSRIKQHIPFLIVILILATIFALVDGIYEPALLTFGQGMVESQLIWFLVFLLPIVLV